jgi:hypothetical protein
MYRNYGFKSKRKVKALASILHEGWMVLPFLLLVMIGMLLRDTLARFLVYRSQQWMLT